MQKVLRMLFVRSWKSCSQQTGQTMAMQSASHAPKGQSLIHGMAEECPAPVASEDRELPFDLRWWARDIIFLCTWRLSWLVVVLGWLLLVRMILLVGSEGVFLYIFPPTIYDFSNPYFSLGTVYSPDDHCGSSGGWKSVFTSTPTRIPRFAITCAGGPDAPISACLLEWPCALFHR